jgi:hypothetical protein
MTNSGTQLTSEGGLARGVDRIGGILTAVNRADSGWQKRSFPGPKSLGPKSAANRANALVMAKHRLFTSKAIQAQ